MGCEGKEALEQPVCTAVPGWRPLRSCQAHAAVGTASHMLQRGSTAQQRLGATPGFVPSLHTAAIIAAAHPGNRATGLTGVATGQLAHVRLAAHGAHGEVGGGQAHARGALPHAHGVGLCMDPG